MIDETSQPSADVVLQLALRAFANGDFSVALRHFEVAVAAGSTEALYYLGIMFNDGDGVEIDRARAREYFQRFLVHLRNAAQSGDSGAQFRLGRMLQYGDLVIENHGEARRWIAEAANLGHPEAQFHLSRLYAYGWAGVIPNVAFERLWLSRAAQSGWPEAMYFEGIAEANDFFATSSIAAREKAIEWLKRALASGYGDAQSLLRQLSAAVDD